MQTTDEQPTYKFDLLLPQRLITNVLKFSRATSTLRTRTEMLFETLVSSPFKQLTRLVARENFRHTNCSAT